MTKTVGECLDEIWIASSSATEIMCEVTGTVKAAALRCERSDIHKAADAACDATGALFWAFTKLRFAHASALGVEGRRSDADAYGNEMAKAEEYLAKAREHADRATEALS